MLQYIYGPEAVGLNEWPSGTLRLPGIEATTDPDSADLFVVPGALTALFKDRDALCKLPYMLGNEEKHVLFDCSDYEQLYDLPCIFIRCNTRTWYLPRDPNTISWPWPVEDFEECIDLPEGGFLYDLSFHGWLSSDVRKVSENVCRVDRTIRCDIAAYSDFTGYIYHEPEGIRRRKEFRRSMKESRVALCPESIPGVFPYRFFEAMSAGRVPLLVGSNYVLPFADEIPYDQFTIQLPAAKAQQAASVVKHFIMTHSDGQIVEMGLIARHYWEKRLDSRNWPELMAYAVEKHLRKVAA